VSAFELPNVTCDEQSPNIELNRPERLDALSRQMLLALDQA